MKNLLRAFSLLICFELIIMPVAHNGVFISKALAEDCPSGLEFNSTLNRCVTSQQTAEIMNAVSNCNGDMTCYKTNAEQALKDAEQEGKVKESLGNKSGLMGSGMGVVAIAAPLVLTIKMLAFKKGSCPATSAIIMTGAGLVAFVGDKMANSAHKKRLKGIREEWDKVVSGDSSDSDSSSTTSSDSTATEANKVKATEGQSQAFEMLAKSEDSMNKAAKTKAGIYSVAAAGFAAGAVIAGLEMFTPGGSATKCKDKSAQSEGGTEAGGQGGAEAGNGTASEGAASDGAASETPPSSGGSVDTGPRSNPNLRGQGDIGEYFENQVIDIPMNPNFALLKDSTDLASYITLANARDSYSSPTLEEYERNKKLLEGIELGDEILSALKNVSREIYNNIGVQNALAADPTSAAAGKIPGMDKILEAPITRLILGGILATWSVTMAMHASKQAKVAKNRAEFLRKMKDEFNDATSAIGVCNAVDRTNPSKPTCYCYTSDGQRSTERANSQVCQALFNGKNLSTSGSYLSSTSSKSCITTTGAEDASCACKSTNTCSKISVGGVSGLDTGTFSLVNGALSDLNNVSAGNTDAANIGSGSFSSAARLLDAANKNLAKTKKGQQVLKKKNELASKMANGLINAAAGQPSPLADYSNQGMPTSAAQAVAELEKELKKSEPTINTASGGGTLAQPGGSGSNEESLNFDFGGGDKTDTSTQVAEAMKQNLDYGQSDINNRSDESLFKVLSNRYQRSAMRRLFDTEGKTKADAPSKSDINQ